MAKAAVKPAVPSAIASLRVRLVGRGTTQSAFTCIFTVASEVGDAKFVTRGDHFITSFETTVVGFNYNACQIDTRHKRIVAHDFAFGDRGQTVFIIDARVGYLDQYIARWQVIQGELLETGGKILPGFIDNKCSKYC